MSGEGYDRQQEPRDVAQQNLEAQCDRSEKLLAQGQGETHESWVNSVEGRKLIPVAAIGQLAQRMREKDNKVPMPLNQTAYTREEARQLMLEYGGMRVREDRLVRPEDGWVQRDRASQDLWEMVAQVLAEEQVPPDHRDTIMGRLFKKLDQWAGQPEPKSKQVSS